MKRFRLWCAIGYILLLLGFGGVYYELSGKHFYHANVAREPVVSEYKEHIAIELQQVIIDTFQKYHKDNWYWLDNWGIDASTFKVRYLTATERGRDVEISFKLSVRISEKSNPSRHLYTDPVITFSATGGGDIAFADPANNSEQPRDKKIYVEMPDVPSRKDLWDAKQNAQFPLILFPSQSAGKPFGDGEANENETREDGVKSIPVVSMPISKQLDTEILNLAKGIQGDPSALRGHLGRMLYLSAVTITTLGFGDIAPLTPLARSLILAEAVAGIIVIGLLIGGGRRNKPPADAPLKPQSPKVDEPPS